MKYYFNKINRNYCDINQEDPFYTLSPLPECNNEEFARYNLDLASSKFAISLIRIFILILTLLSINILIIMKHRILILQIIILV